MIAGGTQHVARTHCLAEPLRHRQAEAINFDCRQVADGDAPLDGQQHEPDANAVADGRGQPLGQQPADCMAVGKAGQGVDVAPRGAARTSRQQGLGQQRRDAPGKTVDREQDVHLQPTDAGTVAGQVPCRCLDQGRTGVQREPGLRAGIDASGPIRANPIEPGLRIGPVGAVGKARAEARLRLFTATGGDGAPGDLRQADRKASRVVRWRDHARECADRGHFGRAHTVARERLPKIRNLRLRVGAGAHPR